MRKILLAAFVSCFLLSSCGGGGEESAPAEAAPSPGKPPPKKKTVTDKAALALAAAERRARKDAEELAAQQGGILILGDDLSAAVGMSSDQSWPGLLAKRLASSDTPLPVVNASLSTDTAQSATSRLAWQLGKFSPKIVVVALGSRDLGNDTPIETIRSSLDVIIRTVLANKMQPVLVGVSAPLSSTPQYQQQAAQMYSQLARKYDIPLAPDLSAPFKRAALLAPSIGEASLSPVAAQPAVMETVWPAVEDALGKLPPIETGPKGKKKPTR